VKRLQLSSCHCDGQTCLSGAAHAYQRHCRKTLDEIGDLLDLSPSTDEGVCLGGEVRWYVEERHSVVQLTRRGIEGCFVLIGNSEGLS